MLTATIAAVAAWVGPATRAPTFYSCPRRHVQTRLNFLDDYKAEEASQGVFGRQAVNRDDADTLKGEINCQHMEELRQVARVKGTEDGVDWASDELASVEVTTIDETGLLLHEVLCSATDQRCIAVDVPILWPQSMVTGDLAEMRRAFTELSRRAYAVALEDAAALPPEYQAQQSELDGLMSLMNAEFGKLLRFYALKHAREALTPTEQVEHAAMTQLTYEGLSLELTTLDIGRYSLEIGHVRLGAPFPPSPSLVPPSPSLV